MRNDTWEALEAQFAQHPVMRAESVPQAEFDTAVVGLSIPVPADFREFVLMYGGAIVGPYPIFGLRAAAAMGVGEGSFLEITSHFREDGWPGVDQWLVISMDHAGNPVGVAEDGQVWCSDHDAGEIVLVASSFEAYLRLSCLNLAG